MEALEKEREPLTHLEAIYIMLPTEQVNRRMDGWMSNGWMNEQWMDEWAMDGWMSNGWMNEQWIYGS